MKFLFKQREVPRTPGALDRLGITKCYLKFLQSTSDRANVTKKEHHHTGFEIHIICQGSQVYNIAGTQFALERGDFLLIPPGVPHQVQDLERNTHKYSITFRMNSKKTYPCYKGCLEPRQMDNLQFMEKEAGLQMEISSFLVENCLLETVVTILRQAGMEETRCPMDKEESAVLSLAKQYIADNIDRAPEVITVAQYCGMSTKQLCRIFTRVVGVSPGAYILNARVSRIEELLQSSELTLGQISEKMHFSSEYYFNAFFKKYSGMPPGAYRKMYEK